MKKRVSLLLVIIMSLGVLVGCTELPIKRELVPKVIEKLTEDTQKAIKNKDADQLRNIWSKVSEYGVKVGKNDDKELADALGRLAACYSKAVLYVELKQNYLLDDFNVEFKSSLEAITQIVKNMEDEKIQKN